MDQMKLDQLYTDYHKPSNRDSKDMMFKDLYNMIVVQQEKYREMHRVTLDEVTKSKSYLKTLKDIESIFEEDNED